MSDLVTRLNAALEGRYEIEHEIGEGGMATVYVARDLRHNRNVALKVLKPELAAVVGAERFLAEIETTANLQHPHILPLFDSGEADSFLFYVMPYVEGETLAERIERERQLPVDEALGIATSIAGALQHAHDRGVIHRDIKPGNILLQDGQPVVGDFGIALAVGAAGGARLTETGLSIGTPFYMSPEQATGDQAVGPASDTYALACVLYEMLVGEPPYPGKTAQAVLGKIIQGTPVSATAIRSSIPDNVDAAIRKALERLPADRFTGAQEFAKALSDRTFRHGDSVDRVGAAPSRWAPVWKAGWGVAAVMAAVAAWAFLRSPPPLPVERFASPFLEGQEPSVTNSASFTLSPDGSMVVYRRNLGGVIQLHMRRWNDIQAVPIRDTEGAGWPRVSPDGQELAFHQAGQVRVLALQGGPVRTLARGFRPTWGPDGYIYLLSDSGSARVPVGGGAVETVTRLGEGEDSHWISGFFDSGRKALLQVGLAGSDDEMRSLDLATGEQARLAYGNLPTYAPTGHLLYEVEGSLMGAPLSDDGEMGAAVALVEGVRAFSISNTGKLFYSVGAAASGAPPRQLMWVDRGGRMTPVDPDWTFDQNTPNTAWSISPDGTMLVLTENTSDGLDIWLKQLPDGPRSRLSFTEEADFGAEWMPDGRTVSWVSGPLNDLDLWSRPANGTTEAEMILDLERSIASAVWSPDGEHVVLRTAGVGGQAGGRDIYLWRPADGDEATPLIAAEYDEIEPRLSPDGSYIVYASNETGQYEVYVRPFPDVNTDRWQISTGGGFSPRWAHSGEELFFMDAGRNLVVAALDTQGGFRSSSPEILFALDSDVVVIDIAFPYEVSNDDQQFVMAQIRRAGADEEGGGPSVILVQNFFEELKERVLR